MPKGALFFCGPNCSNLIHLLSLSPSLFLFFWKAILPQQYWEIQVPCSCESWIKTWWYLPKNTRLWAFPLHNYWQQKRPLQTGKATLVFLNVSLGIRSSRTMIAVGGKMRWMLLSEQNYSSKRTALKEIDLKCLESNFMENKLGSQF